MRKIHPASTTGKQGEPKREDATTEYVGVKKGQAKDRWREQENLPDTNRTLKYNRPTPNTNPPNGGGPKSDAA